MHVSDVYYISTMNSNLVLRVRKWHIHSVEQNSKAARPENITLQICLNILFFLFFFMLKIFVHYAL